MTGDAKAGGVGNAHGPPVIHSGQDESEFLAAVPCAERIGRKPLLEEICHPAEDAVAEKVTVRVVYGFESVQIDQCDSYRPRCRQSG